MFLIRPISDYLTRTPAEKGDRLLSSGRTALHTLRSSTGKRGVYILRVTTQIFAYMLADELAEAKNRDFD